MRWPAPVAVQPVDATVRVPGSKSLTNRALVLAALEDGQSRLRGPLRSRDTDLMVLALRSLGASIDDNGTDWVVTGNPLVAPDQTLDVGNAGTVARFVPPVAALAPGPVHLDGDARIRERPLAPLVGALRALGVRVEASATESMPLTVFGTGSVRGGSITVDASASSQFVSGLLLAGSRYDEGLTLTHVGPPLPSAPHLAMTVSVLRAVGIEVDVPDPNTWRVLPGAPAARDWVIEPDLSSAAPFLAAAVATGGQVRIDGWPVDSTQPGAQLPGFLRSMGATYQLVDGALVLTGP